MNSAAPSAVLTSSGSSTTRGRVGHAVVGPHRPAEQRDATADQRCRFRACRDHGAGALIADGQRLVQPVAIQRECRLWNGAHKIRPVAAQRARGDRTQQHAEVRGVDRRGFDSYDHLAAGRLGNVALGQFQPQLAAGGDRGSQAAAADGSRVGRRHEEPFESEIAAYRARDRSSTYHPTRAFLTCTSPHLRARRRRLASRRRTRPLARGPTNECDRADRRRLRLEIGRRGAFGARAATACFHARPAAVLCCRVAFAGEPVASLLTPALSAPLDRLKRVTVRYAPRPVGQPPLAEFDSRHLSAQRLPRDAVVFFEHRKLHARRQ